LEIRLEDRLEYELERTLDHSVTDRRNRPLLLKPLNLVASKRYYG
jgi:hypothetical protein